MSATRPIDIAAWSSLLDGCPKRLENELGLSVERRGEAVALVAAGIDSMLFNRIFDIDRLSKREARRLLGRYREEGIERIFAHVPRSRLTADAEQRLGALGLSRYHRNWVQLSRHHRGVRSVDCELEVREAEAEHAAEMGNVLAEGFDMPPSAAAVWASLVERPGWTTYVALHEGRVAAAGTLYVEGDLGCLVAAATDREHRHRGAQNALIARRLHRALELGCREVHAETGEAVEGEKNTSESNLRRHGFEPVGVRANFAPEGARW